MVKGGWKSVKRAGKNIKGHGRDGNNEVDEATDEVDDERQGRGSEAERTSTAFLGTT